MPMKTDPRIDPYIAKAAPFAQPILAHLRKVVHANVVDVEETIKWGFPHFMYRGALLCSMAAFKQHVAFGFWKGALLDGVGAAGAKQDAMGQFGRITALRELPTQAVLTRLLRAAMRLNEDGATVPRTPKRRVGSAVDVPAALATALDKDAEAKAAFDAFSPSHRREYCEWIAEARREETRERRIVQALAWLREGKSRNWKYETKSKPA